MPMFNLTEYGDNYSKISGGLQQCYKYIAAVNNNSKVVDFNEANATNSIYSKAKRADQTDHGETDNVEIMIQLKYLSDF